MGAGTATNSVYGGFNPESVYTVKGSQADIERERALAEGRNMDLSAVLGNTTGERNIPSTLELQRQQMAEQIVREQESKARAEAELRQRQMELERQQLAEQVAREQESRDRAEAELRQRQMELERQQLAEQVAREQESRDRAEAELRFSQQKQFSDQEVRRRELAAAARSRQDQMAVFEGRLRDAEQKYRSQAPIPSSVPFSVERGQAMSQFDQPLQVQKEQSNPDIGIGEDNTKILSYQKLLNRLNQYRGGVV